MARSERALRLGEEASYQGKFKHQLAELRAHYPSEHFDWYDDLVYGDLSIHTHPHVAGLDAFAPLVGSVFTIRRPAFLQKTASAAVLGWAFTVSSFAWVSFIWDLPLVEWVYSTGKMLVEAHPNISPGILAQSELPESPNTLPRPKRRKKERLRAKKA